MSSTHRWYELKEASSPTLEGMHDLWKIYDTLCIGQDKMFYHQFSLNNPYDLEVIQSKFDIYLYPFTSTFCLYDFSKLIPVLENPALFERISWSNLKDNAEKRDYLHYWMNINPKSPYVLIVLPITEDFTMIKRELKDMLNFCIDKKLIQLEQKELSILVNALIDFNLEEGGGYSYQSNGVEFYARGDFYPKGSNQIRPAAIKLNFDDHYYKDRGGKQQALITFYTIINQYFSQGEYKVEGRISSVFELATYTALDEMKFLKFNIPIYLDLNKNLNFSPEDLELTSEMNSSFTIDTFHWKDTNPKYQDNRLFLWINNANDWNLAIEISKQIDEEYYFNIELLLNKELEYKGLQ